MPILMVPEASGGLGVYMSTLDAQGHEPRCTGSRVTPSTLQDPLSLWNHQNGTHKLTCTMRARPGRGAAPSFGPGPGCLVFVGRKPKHRPPGVAGGERRSERQMEERKV